MRRSALRSVAAPGAALLVGALAGCSPAGTRHTAATVSRSPAPPAAPATYDPLRGPYESAAQLPKTCDAILSDTDLTGAFGRPQVGDTSYGDYAGLPSIGRTGRVTCGYGISIDQSGNAGQPILTVSVITYNTSTNAVKRVADDVSATEAKGASPHPVMVGGHPATVLDETALPAPAPSTPPTGMSPGPALGTSPAAVPTASSGLGVTELLMADGNRTFVLSIPATELVGEGAVNVLTDLAGLVYRHTLPPSATPSRSGSSSPGAAAGAGASKGSATTTPRPTAK